MKTSAFLTLLLLPILAAPAARAQQTASTNLEDIKTYVPISDRLATSAQPTDEQFAAIRQAGFDLMINLAPAHPMHENEGFLVTSTGMSYLQIPVDFKNPQLGDLELFFRVMEANADRKIWVHCFANMRVSSFVYLYRVIHEGVSEEEAQEALHEVWEPDGAWPGFIERALDHYGKAR